MILAERVARLEAEASAARVKAEAASAQADLSNTMRIFSLAEYCFPFAPRMSRTSFSAATGVGSDFCLILAATMSQKSSVPQTAKFVSGALKRNTAAALTSGRIGRRQIGKIAALSRYSNRSAQATDAQ